jgi:hypothetical protein
MLNYGQCYLNQQRHLLYIPIHMNMTQSMRSIMTEQQWQLTNFQNDKDGYFETDMHKLTVLCILRDPWERWNSAMCQYWYTRELEDITKEELMKVRLDHHSDRQVDYVTGFDPSESFLRFRMGDPELCKILGIERLPILNQSKYRDKKVHIQKRIDDIVDDELRQAVQDHYQDDYRFITHGTLPKAN